MIVEREVKLGKTLNFCVIGTLNSRHSAIRPNFSFLKPFPLGNVRGPDRLHFYYISTVFCGSFNHLAEVLPRAVMVLADFNNKLGHW